MKWRFLMTDAASGAWNMAVDEAILRELEHGTGTPTLRLYSWQPYCISLGQSQKSDQELDFDKVRSAGIDVVRRFTGGRAVYHSNEWTYSVIGPIESGTWSTSLSSTYEKIGRVLALALRSLGGAVELERGDHTEGFQKGRANRPCFASTSRSELVLDGRKLVGSAQRRTSTCYIQHGSLLLGREHLDLAQYLRLDAEEQQKYREQLDAHSISLQEVGLNPDAGQMSMALEMAWASEMGEFPVVSGLSAAELDRLQPLLEKYLQV